MCGENDSVTLLANGGPVHKRLAPGNSSCLTHSDSTAFGRPADRTIIIIYLSCMTGFCVRGQLFVSTCGHVSNNSSAINHVGLQCKFSALIYIYMCIYVLDS